MYFTCMNRVLDRGISIGASLPYSHIPISHVLVSVFRGCMALNEQTFHLFQYFLCKIICANVFGCHCEWMCSLTSALSVWCACPINPILHICLPQRAIVLNCQRKKSAWTEDGEQKVSAKMQNSSFRYSHYLFSFCQKPSQRDVQPAVPVRLSVSVI